MKIVSVINYKGGVGKTTVTANVAAVLAKRGYKVLILDMDAQTSLTFSFLKPNAWQSDFAAGRTIKNWYDGITRGIAVELRDLIAVPDSVKAIVEARGGCLHLICSHLGLLDVDIELGTELGGATLKQTKQRYLRVYRRLAEGLSSLTPGSYDVVLIDCPPNFNIVTRTAIVASQHILIPAKPDFISTLGVDYLLNSVRTLVADYNDFATVDDGQQLTPIDLKVLGVVFTMIQYYSNRPIAVIRPAIASVSNLGVGVFKCGIRENKTVFGESPRTGIPVVLNSYTSESHLRVVREIEAFADEFELALGLTRRTAHG